MVNVDVRSNADEGLDGGERYKIFTTRKQSPYIRMSPHELYMLASKMELIHIA